jgi:hypothetical protein
MAALALVEHEVSHITNAVRLSPKRTAAVTAPQLRRKSSTLLLKTGDAVGTSYPATIRLKISADDYRPSTTEPPAVATMACRASSLARIRAPSAPSAGKVL